MTGPGPEVVAVDVERSASVRVTWADGEEAVFALDELRRGCPCATCRSWRDRGEPAWPRPGQEAELAVADAELVGAWGLGITWSDGHRTGIYPWETLRAWHEAGGRA